jgi:cysteine synthase A
VYFPNAREKQEFSEACATPRSARRWELEDTTSGVVIGMDGTGHVVDGLIGAIGNTPLIRLKRASEITGCDILGKAEFMNPGGSVKDRAGLGIIMDAEARGSLTPGQPGTIVEGTAGNTGIGITLVANARGYRSVIVVPETQSREKLDFLRMIGADLRLVPAKPFSDPGNYVHYSRRLAEELGAVYANQFDNLANRAAHEATTGPEIWDQTGGQIDAFTCSCGTGGTLAGIARALKARGPKARIVLADPMGSSLYSWVKTGELKPEGSSITEGIGQAARVPGNLVGDRALIDDAVQVTDEEALTQVFDLLVQEGICLGGSAGLNVAAAIKVARQLGPGHRVVTILCDGGARYQSKLFNPEFLRERGLPIPPWLA